MEYEGVGFHGFTLPDGSFWAYREPEAGEISFELQIRCRTQGTALDFFAGNDKYASVYGILPFPGVQVPDSTGTKYFCIFKEDTDFKPRELNTYRITYHRGNDEAVFYLNGKEVRREKNIPLKFNNFTVALGIMTEKDLSPEGSVSVHGQTVIAEWSPVTITTTEQ